MPRRVLARPYPTIIVQNVSTCIYRCWARGIQAPLSPPGLPRDAVVPMRHARMTIVWLVAAVTASALVLPLAGGTTAASACTPETESRTLPAVNYGWTERHLADFEGAGAPADTETFASTRHPVIARAEEFSETQGPGLFRKAGNNAPHASPFTETLVYPSFGTPFGFQLVAVDLGGGTSWLTVEVHNADADVLVAWPSFHPGGQVSVTLSLQSAPFAFTADYVVLTATATSGSVLTSSFLFSLVPFRVTLSDSFAGLLTFHTGTLGPDLAVTEATLQAPYFGRNVKSIRFAGMGADPGTTTDPAVAAAVYADSQDDTLSSVSLGAAGSYGGFLVSPQPAFVADLQGHVDAGDAAYPVGYRVSEKWSPAAIGFHYFQAANLRVTYNLPISVDVDPDSMNLRSRGRYVTAYVELWPGCDPNAIDASTVTLNGVPAVLTGGFTNEPGADQDGDGVPDRRFKFDRWSVYQTLHGGGGSLRVIGALGDGTPFRGSDLNRITGPDPR